VVAAAGVPCRECREWARLRAGQVSEGIDARDVTSERGVAGQAA
jgi:hypothetical protein